ncbi:TonB-dependent receptor [Thermodesulfovibrio yellowstonii]|uniref:TonB-dependent receptor n=1 Tax=Thermodesulfovibrio yellowstonii TaxID=28262 RepID=A0A9W6GH18_9BACT|nr:TonB-dependent receptor [Thermodesulfovibrio islandicus]GLI53741.1 TonB-dependent receptor [Thermodesulfovibrio islandicus]
MVFFILFLYFIFLVNSVLAEEPQLEEIIVTATRVEEPKKDVPYSIQVITREDIKNSTAKNAGDLIVESSIGHVHKYPGLSTSSIGLRGFRTDLFDDLKSRVLILINGNRAGTVNLATIPVDDIEKIEIVKGPASVLYGSSAMGGVINIITKQGKEEGIHGSVGGEAGSWKYWKTKGELNGKKGAFDFYLSASRSAMDDYSTKNYGKIENTGYYDETLSTRFGYSFLDKQHISFGFQHWRGWDIGSPGARYSPDPDNYKDIERNRFDLEYKTETFKGGYYFTKLSDENHERSTGNSELTLKKTTTQGLSLQKIFLIDDHRVIIGGQWDRIEVKSSRSAGAPYNPNSQYDSYGLFSEGRLSLFNKRLLLNAGVRYDYFEDKILPTEGITSLKPRKENLDHVTIRGGILYKLTDNLSIKGNAGTAFRAPAPDELATDYVSSWGTHYIGNPDLKPEKSSSYDVGVAYTKDLFKSELTFFHSIFKDKILSYYDNALKAQTFKNVEGAIIQGIEGIFSYDIGLVAGLNFSVEPFLNFTYHTRYSSKDESEIQQYGKTLQYIPKCTAALGIRAGKDNWDLRLIANYTGNEKVIDYNSKSSTYEKVITKNDFTVVNLRGSYRPLKNFELTISIENLFDRAYEYVQYYPMPRRTITGGVKWIF